MEQENGRSVQSVPGTPLQQISQDRFNQLRIPQSPSVPAYLNEIDSPSRRGSEIGVAADIKSKIAFFSSNLNGATSTNSFAIAGSPTRSPIKSAFNSPTKSHSRANSTISISSNAHDTAGLIQTLHAQLEQSRNRERLVAERVESLMEQLQGAHSNRRHEQKESEKEIKAMKKQVHKAELALVRCQQDLHEARNEQEGFKVRAEHERQAKERSRQEAFERARTLASNIEELEVVKRERDILAGENEALKVVQSSINTLSAKVENEVEMRETGVQVELETIRESKDKQPAQQEQEIMCLRCTEIDSPGPAVIDAEAVQHLQEELSWIKSQLKREQDLTHFMNMQCQFKTCPCRMAEMAGVRFVHDHAYDLRQQELARLKGLKRKAEDDLPLPKYITLRESMAQKARGREVEEPTSQTLVESPMAEQPAIDHHIAPSVELKGEEETPSKTHESVGLDENIMLEAMAVRSLENTTEVAGVIALDEAADIPLPSPRSDDMEPTALLEDMTQVMVEPEPAATAHHFAFSTSTSTRRPEESENTVETPILRQSHSAVSINTYDDLFDISRPKYLPPRPSTVMGVRTIDSPIRMVPPSPHDRESLTLKASPPRTMRVPLKDSPLKNSVTQRRSHSRIRERSRARSPTPGRTVVEANSPAADTYFPVTPKQKAERHSRTQAQPYPHGQLLALHTQSQSQTTTTRVPLRGSEEDDLFNPEKQLFDRAPTQPLNVDTPRGRQPHHENAVETHSHSNMLPGTPVTREAALAQIRARRDRARSVAMRKQAVDEESGRVKTPKSAARRAGGGMIGMGRDISNLSQASAPARF